MRTREELENIESQVLAPFAAFSNKSQGRQIQEDEHDFRTIFQRDRDRIVHSSAFRRLEYKTQVFVNHEGDYYRTRLTHSLEVAQIARTIARTLGLNETLAEAISLAHDLGHTPFGHSGQDIMAELMKNYGGFEHNKQSFRIVTLLEKPYAQFSGLNLSYEVLEGITKHSSEYDMPDGSAFLRDGFPSLEAQLANIADEIAYNNHDVDDGLKSELITLDDLKNVEIWQSFYKEVKDEYSNLTDKHIRRLTIKHMINLLVTDLIQYTDKRVEELKIKSLNDVRERGKDVVGFSPEVRKLNTELKRFLFDKLYRHFRVERMAEKAKNVVSKLFEAYTQNPDIIPPEFRQGFSEKESLERIVCDYIAGMTDRFALQEFSKLFDPFEKV